MNWIIKIACDDQAEATIGLLPDYHEMPLAKRAVFLKDVKQWVDSEIEKHNKELGEDNGDETP